MTGKVMEIDRSKGVAALYEWNKPLAKNNLHYKKMDMLDFATRGRNIIINIHKPSSKVWKRVRMYCCDGEEGATWR